MHRYFLFCLAFLPMIFASTGLATAQPSLSLQEVVADVLTRNPELHASAARWEAFMAKVGTSGRLDDPMLMIAIRNAPVDDPLAFDQEPMTSKAIGLSQKIPFYGKRALGREIAELNAESAWYGYEERRIELVRIVKEVWYRLYDVDQSRDVVERNIATLDALVRFTETRYGTGDGLQQDVLKAQMQRSRLEELRIELYRQRLSLEARLNALRFRPAETPVPVVTDALIPPLDPEPAELLAEAEVRRPQLLSLQVLVEKAGLGRELALKDYYPDFTLSLEYMQREPVMGNGGEDMYTAGVSFNLPLQRERRHARVAELEAEQQVAFAQLNMLRNDIRQEVADGQAALERSRRLAQLYRQGLIPQAEQSYEAALAAYRVDKVDFMNVLESQLALFNYEREYHAAVAQYLIRLARLEAAVGAPLTPEEP